ncbi:MAG TPA: MarR family transcriptional regulator [Chthoniobacterales bacterium]
MTKQDYETLATFRYELRKFLHFSEQAALENGLASQQYQALLAIEGYPGRNRITVGELAEQLQIAAHSAVGLADRLQATGLIERTPSEEDRRCVLVSLTSRGRVKLEGLAAIHRIQLRTSGPLLKGLLDRIEGLGS